MVTVGLLVTLQARPGKEDELAGFLAGALPPLEPGGTSWAPRCGPPRLAADGLRPHPMKGRPIRF